MMHDSEDRGVIPWLVIAIEEVIRKSLHSKNPQPISYQLEARWILLNIRNRGLHGLDELLTQSVSLLFVVASRVEILLQGLALKAMRQNRRSSALRANV